MVELPVLPKCRWRGGMWENGNYACHSPKIMAPNGVPADLCMKCILADHQEPTPQELERLLHPKPQVQQQPKEQLLGDLVETALTKVGITKERVSSWLGRPCGCKERQEKLNKLHQWAKGLLGGTVEKAKEDFETIVK